MVKIEFETDNAIFEDSNGLEAKRILDDILPGRIFNYGIPLSM